VLFDDDYGIQLVRGAIQTRYAGAFDISEACERSRHASDRRRHGPTSGVDWTEDLRRLNAETQPAGPRGFDAVRPKLLDGEAPDGIWDALVAQANAAGFEVIRNRRGSGNGYCDFLKKEIAVRPDVAPAQALKTLVHELAHALLHGDEVVRTREIQEVEVESVAYIVCDALGLDRSDYSFAYVARWSDGFAQLVKDTGGRVIGCAKQTLDGLKDSASNESGMEARE
jgi:hypothetical protein